MHPTDPSSSPMSFFSFGPRLHTSNIRGSALPTPRDGPEPSAAPPRTQFLFLDPSPQPSSAITYENTPRSPGVPPPGFLSYPSQQPFALGVRLPSIDSFEKPYTMAPYSRSSSVSSSVSSVSSTSSSYSRPLPNSMLNHQYQPTTTDQYGSIAHTHPKPVRSLSCCSTGGYPSPAPHHSRLNSLVDYSYNLSPSKRASISMPEDLSSSDDDDYDFSDTEESSLHGLSRPLTPTPVPSSAAGPPPFLPRSRLGSLPGSSTWSLVHKSSPLARPRAQSAVALPKRRKSNLEILSEASHKLKPAIISKPVEKKQASHSPTRYTFSDNTYTVSSPIPYKEMSRLIEKRYGGEVRISKKRNQGRDDTTIQTFKYGQAPSLTGGLISPPTSPRSSPAATTCRRGSKSVQDSSRKGLQGRPFSIEMDLELVFPSDLDDLYSILYTKGAMQDSHRVKLLSTYDGEEGALVNKLADGSYSTEIKPKQSKSRRSYSESSKAAAAAATASSASKYAIFSNSLAMVQHFRPEATGYSLVTPIRQSSTQRTDSKTGTCPVVKFTTTPVADFSVQFLKRMAHPRYKADMKIYVIPVRVAEVMDFYTSAAMFLQDQKYRLDNGMSFDTKSKVFSSKNYEDLPNALYDSDKEQDEDDMMQEVEEAISEDSENESEVDDATMDQDDLDHSILSPVPVLAGAASGFTTTPVPLGITPPIDCLPSAPPAALHHSQHTTSTTAATAAAVAATFAASLSRTPFKRILPKPRPDNSLSPSPSPSPVCASSRRRAATRSASKGVSKLSPLSSKSSLAPAASFSGFAADAASESEADCDSPLRQGLVKDETKIALGYILN